MTQRYPLQPSRGQVWTLVPTTLILPSLDPHWTLLFNIFYSSEQFRVTAKLKRRSRDFLYTRSPTPTASPTVSTPTRWYICCSHLTYTDTSLSPRVHSSTRVTLGVVHSAGLDKCTVMYAQRYSAPRAASLPKILGSM